MLAKSFILALLVMVNAALLKAISVMPASAAATQNLESSLSGVVAAILVVSLVALSAIFEVSVAAFTLSAVCVLSLAPLWQACSMPIDKAAVIIRFNFFMVSIF